MPEEYRMVAESESLEYPFYSRNYLPANWFRMLFPSVSQNLEYN